MTRVAVPKGFDAHTRATLRLLAMTGFCSMAAMRVCDPMLIALAREFQTTTGRASAVVAGFTVAYGLLQLFYGPLGDRVGKLRVIVGATWACAGLCLLTAFAPTLELLVTGRAALGAAAAGIIPLSLAWIGDQVAYEARQETLANLMVATISGLMFGQWFGGFAIEHFGWRPAFTVLGALFLVAALPLQLRLRRRPGADVDRATGPSGFVAQGLHLLRLPRVRWVLALVAVEGALAFGALAFMPTRLVQGLHLSATAAGTVMMLYGLGGLLYSRFARWWLGRFGEQGLARLGGTLTGLGLLGLALVDIPAFGVGACLMSGLGFYMLHNTMQTQATQMAPHARGTAVTLFACCLFLGQSLGVPVVGWWVDRGGLEPAMAACGAGILLLGAAVARRVRARPEQVRGD